MFQIIEVRKANSANWIVPVRVIKIEALLQPVRKRIDLVSDFDETFPVEYEETDVA